MERRKYKVRGFVVYFLLIRRMELCEEGGDGEGSEVSEMESCWKALS